MKDSNVHVATHPSGHPNKTAVNAENPIFGRPADPVPEVSIEQAGVVQSDKHHRETVVSPLINEEVAGSGSERHSTNADDWTKTKGAGLTADTSAADSGSEYAHSSGEGSSKITPVVPVGLPTQEQADTVVAQAEAERFETKHYSDGSSATGVAPLPDLSPAQQDAQTPPAEV